MVERGLILLCTVLGSTCGYGGEIVLVSGSSLGKMDEYSRPIVRGETRSLLRVCAVLFDDTSTRVRQVEEYKFVYNGDSLMKSQTPVPMPSNSPQCRLIPTRPKSTL